MIDTKVMQTASNHHDQIRKVVLRVSQNVFHDPGALDASNGMFHSDTDFRDLAIAFFVLGG